MHFVLRHLTVVLAGILFAYAIWFRPHVIDIPWVMRLAFSVIPGIVLYRVALAVHLRFISRGYPYLRGTHTSGASAGGFLVVTEIAALAALVLYHLWRDLRLDS